MTAPFKKSALLMVLALLAAAVLIGHQTVPPMDRDESRFAQASRQMVESGDLVTIRFQDELRAKKVVSSPGFARGRAGRTARK